MAFKLSPANTDGRKPVPQMTPYLMGKLFVNRGYISPALFEALYERGLQLITKVKKNMKNRLVKLMDFIMLRKRALIESINDQLQNICPPIAFSSSERVQLFSQFDGWAGCIYLP